MNASYAVLGAGAWGTAFALHLARLPKTRVTLWARDEVLAREMSTRRENTRYLPRVALPETLFITSDLKVALQSADLMIAATPIAALASLLKTVFPMVGHSPPPFFWLSKGFLMAEDQIFLPHQYVSRHWNAPVGVVSGPSFAQEVASGLPTALVVASDDLSAAEQVASQIRSTTLRAYPSDDIVGVELGGAMKNVLAIAAGVCDGLNLGQNARASLITRGLAEMTRLAEAMMGGNRSSAITGLAGLGDLILTCTGNLSRNRRVGLMLAEGMSLPDILSHLGHVAEGVTAATAAVTLAKRHNIDLPITGAVAAIIKGELSPKSAAEILLTRAPKQESGIRGFGKK
ncbi:MAG: NAD(P)-dependent glycerol-3-phosphate dehydrogenase [Burkholderiales bacterium]|jgi:glycerol-3-phosphate dehydrogenase (NAD(P)+)|nr:NAD(P)-dependent glycerol-3-phosphate dehydrogenase [Burkholderiales bacterium]